MSDLSQWQTAPIPDGRDLSGQYVDLKRFVGARDGAAIFDALGGRDGINQYTLWMAMGPYTDAQSFIDIAEKRVREEGFITYSVFNKGEGFARGTLAYMRLRPQHGALELGAVTFGQGLARTRAATEAVFLMAKHAFEDLGYRRFEWKCDKLNQASNRAAKRFGFNYEGIFRNDMVVKGRNRDTAWYAMTIEDWPVIKASFETWLCPDNFDSNQVQLEPLNCQR